MRRENSHAAASLGGGRRRRRPRLVHDDARVATPHRNPDPRIEGRPARGHTPPALRERPIPRRRVDARLRANHRSSDGSQQRRTAAFDGFRGPCTTSAAWADPRVSTSIGPANSEPMFDLLAADALAGVEALSRRRDIDGKRIGLFGVSQADCAAGGVSVGPWRSSSCFQPGGDGWGRNRLQQGCGRGSRLDPGINGGGSRARIQGVQGAAWV